MNKRNFPIHGHFRFVVEGQLLLVEGEGPGNMEVAIQYHQQVQPFREQLKQRPWASLVKMRGMPLLPPEAKQIMAHSIIQAMRENLVATAVVLVDVEFASSARQFWSDIYQNTSLSYRFFDTEEEARAWLSIQLSESEAQKKDA